ncbi:MAG: tRNA epoxyqueuosine(34) reductase QueG [Bacillota bacterium]|nr:tRNA epoxyqueuosine(34) reductase QueG [Bacillota bacterium]
MIKSTEQQILALAKEVGFDLTQIIAVEDAHAHLIEHQNRLAALFDRGLTSSFISDSSLERSNINQLLPEAKSIILVGLAYQGGKLSKPKPLHGKLASSAQGDDYHDKMYHMLTELINRMKPFLPEFKHYPFVDNKPIMEKALAVKAGFGFFGKNSLLINKEKGSYFFLGGLITDIELCAQGIDMIDEVSPELGCEGCEKCLKACPTAAIEEAGVINTNKCLAQLTQLKGIIPRQFRNKFGYCLYGCDICQQVCPYNQQDSHSGRGAAELNEHNLIEMLTMNNKEFAKSFGVTAAGWRGKTVLQRNAIIALGNWGSKEAIPSLVKALGDQRPVIRAHAAWALGKIGGIEVEIILKGAQEQEENLEVLKEITMAIIDCRQVNN